MNGSENQDQPLTSRTVKKDRRSFLAELKDEFIKVTWPTKEDLRFFTTVVIGATFAFGIGIYFIDLLIKGSLDMIQGVARLILG